MKKVYLDNASTTMVHPEVISAMTTVLEQNYGNPSSTHSFGREAKNIIELSRKSIAKCFNVSAQEIIFTSGGTESNNWILRSAVVKLGVSCIITSKIEHHAVLHPILQLEKEFNIQVKYVNLNENGTIDLTHLVELLSESKDALVSLMHVNNEIGSVLDLDRVGRICKQHNALFHSDTIQSLGKEHIDLQETHVDFIVASAHKFHGPKGVGFVFVRKNLRLHPMMVGGEQEKGLRAGTEATHQIAGMVKALELAYKDLPQHKIYIQSLKEYLIEKLRYNFPDFKINGDKNGFYNLINITLPFSEDKTAMILFFLDMKGIAVSRGSACQSGSIKPSHVLSEILPENDVNKPNLRISLSQFNTEEDVDILIAALKSMN